MIQSAWRLYWLLAVQSEWRQVWGRFDHESFRFEAVHLWAMLGILGLLLGYAVVAYLRTRRSKREFIADSPRRLFRELCRAHRLPYRSRSLIRRLAAAHGVNDFSELFVEPRYFDSAGLPAELKPAAQHIRRLREQLFG